MAEVRHDPISRKWVIIAPEREHPPLPSPASIRETAQEICPFCPEFDHLLPATIRHTYQDSPDMKEPDSIRVIPNIHPALTVETHMEKAPVGMFDWISGVGADEIIIETDNHTADIPDFSVPHLVALLSVYRERLSDLV